MTFPVFYKSQRSNLLNKTILVFQCSFIIESISLLKDDIGALASLTSK